MLVQRLVQNLVPAIQIKIKKYILKVCEGGCIKWMWEDILLTNVGAVVGSADGFIVGFVVGDLVGFKLGTGEGQVGRDVGCLDGCIVGRVVG